MLGVLVVCGWGGGVAGVVAGATVVVVGAGGVGVVDAVCAVTGPVVPWLAACGLAPAPAELVWLGSVPPHAATATAAPIARVVEIARLMCVWFIPVPG